MKNIIIVTIALLIVSTNTSCDPCTKHMECPAHDGTLLFSWFPYKVDNTYYFKDTAGDIDTLVIGSVDQTDAYEFDYKTGMNYRERFCEVKGTINSRSGKNYPGLLQFHVTHFEEREYESNVLELSFYGSYLASVATEGTSITDRGSSSTAFNYQVFDQYELDGITYNDLFLISTKDTSKAAYQGVDKIYIVKEKGVIGYRTYPDGREYRLQ